MLAIPCVPKGLAPFLSVVLGGVLLLLPVPVAFVVMIAVIGLSPAFFPGIMRTIMGKRSARLAQTPTFDQAVTSWTHDLGVAMVRTGIIANNGTAVVLPSIGTVYHNGSDDRATGHLRLTKQMQRKAARAFFPNPLDRLAFLAMSHPYLCVPRFTAHDIMAHHHAVSQKPRRPFGARL